MFEKVAGKIFNEASLRTKNSLHRFHRNGGLFIDAKDVSEVSKAFLSVTKSAFRGDLAPREILCKILCHTFAFLLKPQ